ncbi:MAG: hypothetical protein A2Y10_12910 [Planctomycetes bacterium GWF2_41_51]|nr:MAG: hypothetical protein A2Y10_12910 [Planctomycetes bacterium GWF2_41_51]HBG28227.1 hypothetical protein [Phycisphaerales bacterium]
MKHLIVITIVIVLNINFVFAKNSEIQVVSKPDTSVVNKNYEGNRAPLIYSPFIKLPPYAIKPNGWLKKQLQLQVEGFHGHLTEISKYLNKENNSWLAKDGSGEYGWEEVPYWLKGYSNAGYILNDAGMQNEAKIWIEGALNSQRPDGWFGPDKNQIGGFGTNKNMIELKDKKDLWPNMVMLFVLQDYYEFSGDSRIIPFMTRYFQFLKSVPEDKFLLGHWPSMRGGDQLYSIYWLYNRTGDSWLLELAQKVHRKTARWDKGIIDNHNVNIAQAFREPTVYSLQTKSSANFNGAERNWQQVRAMFGQVPGGMFGADERSRPGFIDPHQAVETCGMVEMMLSCEILLQVSGDPVWADRCEDVAFNSFPAALTADYKALRYLTAVNMVVSDAKSKSPGILNKGPMFLMNPNKHRCCQHNFGHGWPYFIENLWQATAGNGLAAVIFAPSEVTAKVADDVDVTIIEKTRYPFEDKITFIIKPEKETAFPLYLRIPGWCEKPVVVINGSIQEIKAKPLSYICINRQWKSNDKIELTLPMNISIRQWKKNKNSISVDRGPLTYSLQINEKYVRNGGTDQWPAWEIYPASPWNYGLVLNEKNPAASFEFVQKDWPADDQPFAAKSSPLQIKVRAKKIPQWQLDQYGLAGVLQDSPVLSNEPTENVTLIPMGAAKLRIGSFPTIAEASNGHKWIASAAVDPNSK